MTATLTIDDDVMAAAQRAAADRAVSVDTLVSRLLREALADRPRPVISTHPESGLPYFKVPSGTPAIDLDAVRQALEEAI